MAEGYLKRKSGFETKFVHGAFKPKLESSWPTVPSLTMSVAFEQESPEWNREFYYGRNGNPTRKVLEQSLAEIENAKYALTFSSGMGAVCTITCLLSADDNIVAAKELYGGTRCMFNEIFTRMKIKTTFVDTIKPESIVTALKANTKLVWLECPSNPLLKMTDIAKVSELAHKQKQVIVVVDNTFATPYFQKPLDLGADISMHSATKYMNGHGDVIMGSLATNNKELFDRIHSLQMALGTVPSPFDCYQVLRGLKTLPFRMEQHMKSALKIASYLEKNPQVERIVYPGLPSHPQHQLVKKQCYGTSGMLSFFLKGGLEKVKLLIKNLKVIVYAGSLGGCTSQIMIPYLMSHASLSEEEKKDLGITQYLIRMSVGLESAEDLIQDLSQALKKL